MGHGWNQGQNNVPVPKFPSVTRPLYTPHIQEGFSPVSLDPLERQDKRGLFPILLLTFTGNKEAAVPVFGRWARLGSPSPPDFQAWAQVSDARDQITHHSGQDIIPYYQFHANSSALLRIKSQLQNLAFQGERKLRGGVFVGVWQVGNIPHKDYR